jgi:hypothetical protein
VQPDADAPISLQLEHVEFADRSAGSCAACAQRLVGSYFEINGKICCVACHDRLAAKLAARPGAAGFLRAAAAGLGGAVAGAALYFAVRAATGYELSLISILVGFMVGKAVHWGARGHGGWLYQGLAILLTYLAIVSSYTPWILDDLRQKVGARSATSAAALPGPAAPAATTSAPATGGAAKDQAPRGPLATAVAYVIGSALLLYLAAVLPFLGGVGILGLIILAVGLFEAWKLNRRPRVEISGPHAIAPPGWRR